MRNHEFHKGVDGLKSLGTPALDDFGFIVNIGGFNNRACQNCKKKYKCKLYISHL